MVKGRIEKTLLGQVYNLTPISVRLMLSHLLLNDLWFLHNISPFSPSLSCLLELEGLLNIISGPSN